MLRRLVTALAVLFGISVIVFLIFFATPGADPAARLAGRGASPETLALVRAQFGLDQPLPVQYARLMARLFVTRDLTSFVNRGQLVVPTVLRAAPVTLALALGGAALFAIAGLLIGLVTAALRGGVTDRVVTALALLGASLPVYWVGEVVNLVTQDRLHDTWAFRWVPPLGTMPALFADPGGWFRALILPWITLALLYAGFYARTLRAALIDAYGREHVRTARAQGAGEVRILLTHVLPAALGGVVALFGLDLGALIGGGTLLTEVVFGLRGVGRLTYDALATLDLPMIMATVLYAAAFVVLSGALIDSVQAALDPRLREG